MPALVFSVVLTFLAMAHPAQAREAVFNTKTKSWMTLEEAAASIHPGTIVVFGEEHMTAENEKDPVAIRHHENQARWLEALKSAVRPWPARIRLGLEFLAYPHQSSVDEYLAGRLSQGEFLKQVQWGLNPFTPYDRLMQLSLGATGLGTRALNAAKELSSRVAKVGREGLSEEELALAPPLWERGGALYYERFAETMRGHVPEDKIEKYFWAQSLWDDTMAWQATRDRETDEIVNVIVGEFHVEFGHGLPARLRRHGEDRVITVLQHFVPAHETWPAAIEPDAQYGDRADFIYVFSLD